MKETKHEKLAKRYDNPIEGWLKSEIAYTLHPPKGEFTQEDIRKTPAYVSKRVAPSMKDILPSEIMVSLNLQKTGFEKGEQKRKPIYAIEAFLTAHKAGLYPPMWAFNYIAQVFSDWHELQGTKSLDELFKLKLNKGQKSVYTKKHRDREKRDISICLNIFVLKHLFNFEIDEALLMIVNRLAETPNLNITLSEDTIRGIYKEHRKTFDKEYFKEHFLKWSKKKKLSFLEGFPEDSFPTKKGKTFNEMMKK